MQVTPQYNISFGQNLGGNAYERLKKLQKYISSADIKNTDVCAYIKNEAVEIQKIAQNELSLEQKNNSFQGKIDQFMENVFVKFSKIFAKQKNSEGKDLSKSIINAVLTGNILKDLMTGIVSSTQSFTNPDFSKEKRLFIGSYDVAACLTTITASFILGPMAVGKIKSGYTKLLKPMKTSPKYDMCLAGLTSLSAIILQSIVAKRMIAPAISTPLAGIMKEKLQQNH